MNNKKNFKKTIKRLFKVSMYAILTLVSYQISIKLANNFIVLLHKIIDFGVENITKVIFALLLVIITNILYFKK
jgi:hypothetical protein